VQAGTPVAKKITTNSEVVGRFQKPTPPAQAETQPADDRIQMLSRLPNESNVAWLQGSSAPSIEQNSAPRSITSGTIYRNGVPIAIEKSTDSNAGRRVTSFRQGYKTALNQLRKVTANGRNNDNHGFVGFRSVWIGFVCPPPNKVRNKTSAELINERQDAH
jgi:hypothetical protein